jgi:hypothetical protein
MSLLIDLREIARESKLKNLCEWVSEVFTTRCVLNLGEIL